MSDPWPSIACAKGSTGRWVCIDFDDARIHVRQQWAREGALTEPKTPAAIRRVVIAPDLVQFLRKHKARSRFSTENDFVFASRKGTPLGHRNVCRAFTRIVETAGLDGERKLTFHGLRHIYASMVIERGISSTVLAEQMGHTSSTVTEQRYIHLFNRVRTDNEVRTALQQAMRLGKSLASAHGQERETADRLEDAEELRRDPARSALLKKDLRRLGRGDDWAAKLFGDEDPVEFPEVHRFVVLYPDWEDRRAAAVVESPRAPKSPEPLGVPGGHRCGVAGRRGRKRGVAQTRR